MRSLGLFICIFLLWPAIAKSQQGREEAVQLEAMHEKANKRQFQLEEQAKLTRSQILQLQKKLISIATRINKQNSHSVEVEEHLMSLRQRETSQLTKLLADQKSMGEMMAALQRLAMSPPPPLAVSPGDTKAAARASLLLQQTVPKLQVRAEELKNSLESLRLLRQEISASAKDLERQMQILSAEQLQLQSMLGQRQALETRLRGDALIAKDEASSLAERANNLRELIRQLEVEARKTTPSLKPPPPKVIILAPGLKPELNPQIAGSSVWQPQTGRFTDSRGQLDYPVHGQVIAKYGRSLNPDLTSGMVFRTSRRAQIIAPHDARIAFAGKFRNLGKLLILDVGDGYYIILSGLSDTYVVKDQTVLAGEPLGKMANRRKPAPEFYLEFRKLGQPFDPEPWLKQELKKTANSG
ncbi:MAG: peptidoglycan DD-metalloendopeptidase family protein [Robiginitomaculum sp.]|nr:peptidoglycan DD-metalloendopeptidase family protein [Robiginitomaculum sp.]